MTNTKRDTLTRSELAAMSGSLKRSVEHIGDVLARLNEHQIETLEVEMVPSLRLAEGRLRTFCMYLEGAYLEKTKD